MAHFNLQDYETVETRLGKFWEANPNGRVYTELVSAEAGQFIVKAFIYRNADDAQAVATGYAEETVTTRGVNQTSALENCETSAIGRALANWIYATKGSRPSREEMEKVQRGQTIAKTGPKEALTEALLAYSKDKTVRKSFVTNTLGRDFTGITELTDEEAQTVIDALAALTAPFTN